MNKEKNKFVGHAISFIEMLVGTAMCAAAFGLVIIPQGFVAGGVTGLAVIIGNITGIPLSAAVLAINIALLGFGWWAVGRAFIAKTVAVSFIFPVMLEFFLRYPLVSISKDNLLCTFVAGALLGIGTGITLHSGASSGGLDIIAVSLNKKFKTSVELVMNICNVSVIVLQAIHQSLPEILYGILVMFITGFIVGKVVTYGTGEIQVIIFSEDYEKVRRALIDDLDVGVTLLTGESGYKKIEFKPILSIMPYEKVGEMKRIIKEIDPTAFIIINEVHSVLGRGYSYDRYSSPN